MKNAKHAGWAVGIAFSLLTATVQAGEPKISGFIDTSYTYDLNMPLSRRTALRSFDGKTDAFLLNAVQVNIEGSESDGIGYYAELAFGTDASSYKAAGTGADAGLPGAPSTVAYNFEVQEAYLTYKCPTSNIMLKAGKFVTFQGIEVIEAKDNYLISRGHVFGLVEPFTHVGALAGYAFSKADIWVGAVNGWDVHTDNNAGKTLVAKIGLSPMEGVSGAISMTHGSEQAATTNNVRDSFDTTWFLSPMKALDLALQFNAGIEDQTNVADRNGDGLPDGGAGHWYAASIQPKVNFTEKFSVGHRYEWVSDLDGARTGTPMIIQNIAIAPTYSLTENLMARLEYRHDWTTVGTIFEEKTGAFNRGDTNSVAAELIYKF